MVNAKLPITLNFVTYTKIALIIYIVFAILTGNNFWNSVPWSLKLITVLITGCYDKTLAILLAIVIVVSAFNTPKESFDNPEPPGKNKLYLDEGDDFLRQEGMNLVEKSQPREVSDVQMEDQLGDDESVRRGGNDESVVGNDESVGDDELEKSIRKEDNSKLEPPENKHPNQWTSKGVVSEGFGSAFVENT